MTRLEKFAIQEMYNKHCKVVELVKRAADPTPINEKEADIRINRLEEEIMDLHDALITGE